MVKNIVFPNSYDAIRQEAKEHSRMSPADRLRVLDQMMRFGSDLIQRNPHKQRALELQEAEERAWAEAQLIVLKRYETRHGA